MQKMSYNVLLFMKKEGEIRNYPFEQKETRLMRLVTCGAGLGAGWTG